MRVVDDRDFPIYGVGVTFAVVQGSASLSASSAVISDRFGLARVRLAAGPAIGGVRVRALISTGNSIDFNEAVSTSIPERITRIYGDSLSEKVGGSVYPLTVQVTDYFGNPVANVPVYYEAITPGAAALEAQPLHTGDDGQTAAAVRLGTLAGIYLFQARSSHLTGSPVPFTLIANAAAPRDVALFEGDQQAARALKSLSSPVKVRVADQYNNGVPGQLVQFAPLSGGGTVNPQIVVTDGAGLAAAQWTLGGSGTQRLQARCQALPGKQAIFSATLIENLAPVIYAVADTAVLETETLVFEVMATDPDGGQVTLSAQNLPTGATFDPVNSRLFIWRPDFKQQGTYQITFIARDDNGGQTSKVVTVRVQDLNRPPAIHAFQPESFYYLAPTFKPVTFLVQASDQDGDALVYSWRLNGRIVGRKDTLSILTGTTLPAQFTLIVTVSDRHDSVSQAWSVQQATAVALEPADAKLPEHNRLVQNYPNPFNPETTISYELATAQRIEIHVYNMSGQLVRTLISGNAPAGYHSLRWNGMSDAGEMVPSGIYPCVLSGEGYRQTIKLVFLK